MPAPYNIVVSYDVATNTWIITPCSLPVDKNPNFPKPNPVIITMTRAGGQSWTFTAVNDLNSPEFSYVISADGATVTLTDRRTDQGDNPYTVSIRASNGPQTSPQNLCKKQPAGTGKGGTPEAGAVTRSAMDKGGLVDAPPMIRNE